MKITINKRLVSKISDTKCKKHYWEYISNRYIVYYSKNRHTYII